MNVFVNKLRKYCAYQDRCHQEVRNKLNSWKIYGSEREMLITKMIEEGFLDEERFARSYARGKFRMKGYGRRKIMAALKSRDISEYCIQQAFKEISEEEYQNSLRSQMEKRIAKNNLTDFEKRADCYRFFMTKGFEPEYIEKIYQILTLG